jgi:hypothetical protein
LFLLQDDLLKYGNIFDSNVNNIHLFSAPTLSAAGKKLARE